MSVKYPKRGAAPPYDLATHRNFHRGLLKKGTRFRMTVEVESLWREKKDAFY
jgi:hypothetical protein